ncbi:MAG: sulfatase-like hydrolase/transferase [Rhodospirillaceae bacterium]|nr:sulfatase-like hydrolase/transferase [Rhodospirillaceae bacterium]
MADTAPDRKRPNFLMIVTDQHRADYLGCAGHPILKTPHIDGIAARGVRFDRFYVANPVCMPNRATLVTGRMPSLHGVRHNGIPLALSENTFVDLMRHEGYRTALIGKSHLQNMTGEPPSMQRRIEPRDDAFAEARKPEALAVGAYEEERPWTWKEDPDHEIPTPFYGFEDVSLATMHSDKVGAAYIAWMKARGGDPATMVGPENALPHDYVAPQGWRTAVPEELYPTSYVAEESIGWLDAYAQEGGNRPFFLTASFPDPHHPFTPPGKYWDMYDPADFDLPESFHRLSNQAPPTLRWMWENRPPGDGSRNVGQVAYTVTERRCRRADPRPARRPRPRRRHHRRLHRGPRRFSRRPPDRAQGPDALSGAGQGAVHLGRAGRPERRCDLFRACRHRRHRPDHAEPRRHRAL